MIREIVKFMQSVNPEHFKEVMPSGLHILIKLDDKGVLINNQYEYYNQKNEKTDFIKKCEKIYMYTDCVSANKRLDGSHKRINLSCSPFCLGLRKEHLDTKLSENDIDEYFTKMLGSSQQYCTTEEQEKWNKVFYEFCKKNLLLMLNTIFCELKDTKNIEIKSKECVYVYLDIINVIDYLNVYESYLEKRVFNKEKYNVNVSDKVFGISDSLSTFSEKKQFLKHQTANFDLNLRVSVNEAIYLYRFFKYVKKLPRPLPIFIDKNELNDDFVRLFNAEEDGRIGFAEIIKAIYELRKGDLGNYYLLYFFGNDLLDFDFVSSFEYKIPEIKIENLFLKNGFQNRINNIFEFERIIVREIFNNQLITKTNDDKIMLKYFDNNINPTYMTAAMYHLILKYRKIFYNYIYKSRRNELNSRIFHEIMSTGIIDDLKNDKYSEGKHSNDYKIRLKLNIWFNLYRYFEPIKNKRENNMAAQIKQLKVRNEMISEKQDEHIENDDEFAFMSGQVIYYLLSQSEASKKTHALLEPFLQKTDCEQFKMAIARTFEQFKHAIHFKHSKFEKMASEVLSFSTEKNVKKLMPLILAGYFSENIIYKKSK